MKSIAKLFGAAISVTLTVYFLVTAARVLAVYDLRNVFSPALFWATAVLTLCHFMLVPLSAWAWQRTLRLQGEYHDGRTLVAILSVSQFAKYLPGNVAHVAGRAVLSVRRGIKTSAVMFSLAAEVAMTLAAGLLLSILAFSFSPHAAASWISPRPTWFVWAALLSLAVMCLLWFVGPTLKRSLQRRLGAKTDGMRVEGMAPNLAAAFAAYATTYVLIGFGLWVTTLALGESIRADYAFLVGAFALAWTLGFVTPGAPAGIGVREGALMWLLRPLGPPADILTLIGAARLAALLADVFWFLIGLVLIRGKR